MILQFPFLSQLQHGPLPPSLASQSVRWRPYVPLTVHGPLQSVHLGRVLVDSGADDTILPLGLAKTIGVEFAPAPSGQQFGVRYRGEFHATKYAPVELELVDDYGSSLRWSAIVGFSAVPLHHPVLGQCGCFDVLDVKFIATTSRRTIEFEAGAAFTGTVAAAV